MALITLQIEVPDAVPGAPDQIGRRQYIEAAVAKWYELGLVSQSRGAELLGLGREEFLDLLARFDVAVMQADAASLDIEFRP